MNLALLARLHSSSALRPIAPAVQIAAELDSVEDRGRDGFGIGARWGGAAECRVRPRRLRGTSASRAESRRPQARRSAPQRFAQRTSENPRTPQGASEHLRNTSELLRILKNTSRTLKLCILPRNRSATSGDLRTPPKRRQDTSAHLRTPQNPSEVFKTPQNTSKPSEGTEGTSNPPEWASEYSDPFSTKVQHPGPCALGKSVALALMARSQVKQERSRAMQVAT